MIRNLVWTSMVILTLTAGWLARGWFAPGPTPSATGPEACRVMRGQIEQSVKARGIVKAAPTALVRVGFPFPKELARRISRLEVVEGDVVPPGALLAELDIDDLKANLAQLTGELHVLEQRLEALRQLEPVDLRLAESVLAERKAQREWAQRNLDRIKRLQFGQAGTQQEFELAVSDMAQAIARVTQAETSREQIGTRHRTDIAVLEAQIKQARAAIASVEVQIAWSTLRSPLAAPMQVFAVHQRQGELTSGQPGVPVLTLLDTNQLQVHLYVDEADFGRLQIGQPVLLRVESYADETVKGRIVRILPQALLQENVVYYPTVVEVAAEQRSLLRAEMTAIGHVQAGSRENVLWLPLAALRSRPGGWYVQRPGPQGPVETPVRIGWKDQGRVEIREGLAEGDEVLLPR